MSMNYRPQSEMERILRLLRPNLSRQAPSFADQMPDFSLGVPQLLRDQQLLAQAQAPTQPGTATDAPLMELGAETSPEAEETAKAPEPFSPPSVGSADAGPLGTTASPGRYSEHGVPAVPKGERPPPEPAPKDDTRETPPVSTAADVDTSRGLVHPGTWDENNLRDDFDAQGKPISHVSEVVAVPYGDRGRAVVLPVLPGSTDREALDNFVAVIQRGEAPSHLGIYDSLEAAQQAAERLSYKLHPAPPGESQARPGEPLAELLGTPAGPPEPGEPFKMPGQKPLAEAAGTPAGPPPPPPSPGPAVPGEPFKAPSQREALQSKIDQYTSTMLDRPENDAAGTMARSSTPGGQRPNLYGYEDEAGYDMDQRAAQVRQLYSQEKPSTHWTDEFLRTHNPPPDMGQIKRRTFGMSMVAGYGEATKLYERFMAERQAYEQGLMQARQMDLLQGQVPIETAQALAQSGLSPEAAVRARRGGPEVSAYKSGGYAMGPNLTGTQRKYDEAILKQLGGESELRQKGAQGLIEKELSRTANIEQAQAQKRGGIDEQLGQRLIADWITSQAPGWDAQRAAQWVQTRDASLLPEGVSPEKAESLLVQAQTSLLSTKGRESLAPRPMLKATEKKKIVEVQNNPSFIKHMQGIHEANKTARDALAAYYALPEEAKKSLVQLGRSVPDVIQSMVASSSGKPWEADMVAVRELIGKMTNENAGLAVTDNELQQVAGRTGTTADWYDPFRSGEGLEAAIKNRIKLLQTRLEPWQKFLEPVE